MCVFNAGKQLINITIAAYPKDIASGSPTLVVLFVSISFKILICCIPGSRPRENDFDAVTLCGVYASLSKYTFSRACSRATSVPNACAAAKAESFTSLKPVLASPSDNPGKLICPSNPCSRSGRCKNISGGKSCATKFDVVLQAFVTL